MENHPIPRSVTTFEFKLIGWFTVKEFIYLLLAVGIAVIVYFLVPIPYLNVFMAALVVGAGAGMVFYKYNERPLDVWIRNLVYRLLHPSQYFWDKDNPAPDFLSDVVITSDSIIVSKHLDASAKLQTYMDSTGSPTAQTDEMQSQAQSQAVQTLIHEQTTAVTPVQDDNQPVVQAQDTSPQPVHPYISGVISNTKEVPLPNIMVYINSNAGELVRILKTNKNGVFASFHPLPSGSYIISPKDLGGTYFFDTMTLAIDGPQKEPVQIFSKELL